MRYYLGIDPGISGALAVLDENEDIVQIFDMPTLEVITGKSKKQRVNPQSIVSELKLFKDQRIEGLIEQVNAMPNQGVTSMFSFGRSLGILEGVLAGLDIPYNLVTPTVWKKRMSINSSKDGARELAMRTWSSKSELFKRKKDDGRAEAALLALYLIRDRK
jgi:crossover junction endodeoxyribonuclease RuvC